MNDDEKHMDNTPSHKTNIVSLKKWNSLECTSVPITEHSGDTVVSHIASQILWSRSVAELQIAVRNEQENSFQELFDHLVPFIVTQCEVMFSVLALYTHIILLLSLHYTALIHHKNTNVPVNNDELMKLIENIYFACA